MGKRISRKRGSPSDSRRYYDWFDRAEDDMVAAELLKEDNRCYLCAAFHCQQAIEKALKGYILLRSGELVDGHNLTWLCKYAVRYNNNLSKWLHQSTNLNKCYIETRYPTDISADMTKNQVEAAYEMANDMFEFILDDVELYLEA